MKSFLAALKAYWFLILVIIVILGCAAGYFAGYRLDQGGIVRVGTLSMTGLPEKSTVYIDSTRRVRPNGGDVSLSLTPGAHTIIVDAPDQEPWNELFTIAASADTALSPILVPRKVERRLIIGADQAKGFALVRSTVLPTKQKPLVIENGCAMVYVSGSRIIAEGTTTPACALPAYLSCPEKSAENPLGGCAPTILYAAKDPIRSVLAFPGRTDAIIFVAGSLASVLEADPREPQFIAPIFKGAVAGIAPWSPQSVVVSTGSQVIELPL